MDRLCTDDTVLLVESEGMLQRLVDEFDRVCKREMKVGVQDLGVRLNVRGVAQPLVAGLYSDDTVLLAESEGMLQRIVDEFDRICKRRKLKVNTGKRKVMVFKRARDQTFEGGQRQYLDVRYGWGRGCR